MLDLATGERGDVSLDDWPGEARIVRPGTTGPGQAAIAAVDGRTVYVTDTRGVMAWDALDGEEPVLLPGPPGVEVRDVQDERILYVVRTFEPEERDGTTTMVEVTEQRVGPDLEDGRPVPGVGGLLSPDGRSLAYLERSSVDGVTYSTSVGNVDGDAWTPVAPAEYDSVWVFRWLDADTFAARASTSTEDDFRSDVLTCEARTGTCAPVPDEIDSRAIFATGELR